MARGKTVGDVFFDVFRHPEHESGVKTSKKFSDPEILKLSSLSVRDCNMYMRRKISVPGRYQKQKVA